MVLRGETVAAPRGAMLGVLFLFAFFAFADAASGASGGEVVRMTGGGFGPERVEIQAGEAVVFENGDAKGHWPASDAHPMHDEYPDFDPKEPVEPGEEWSFTFEEPGEWSFHDHMNPMFTGEIVVREESGFFAPIGNFFAAISSLFSGEEHVSHGHGGEHGEGSAGEKYAEIVRDEDPRAALARLGADMEEDDEVLRGCHPVAHEIGHTAYEKYGDFGEAMKFQDEVCNSGYVHGVIEERFAQSDDVLTDMKTMCADYGEAGGYLEWQCYHGIGHGVMYFTSNDLPRALGMCDAFEGAAGRSSCYNGTFMENFGADGNLHIPPSTWTTKTRSPRAPSARTATRWIAIYTPRFITSAVARATMKARWNFAKAPRRRSVSPACKASARKP